MKNRIIKILEDTIPDKEGWLTFDNAAEQINALIEKVIEERIPMEKERIQTLRAALDFIQYGDESESLRIISIIEAALNDTVKGGEK